MNSRKIRNYKACFLMSGTVVSRSISEWYFAAFFAALPTYIR